MSLLFISMLFILPFVLAGQAEGGIQTWEWRIKFDVVELGEPTRVHCRLDCTANPDSGGADSSRFTLRGLGDIENLVAYDPATRESLRFEYSHPEGIVYFGMVKTSPYTFTIECDVVNNLVSTAAGREFHWDTSGWSQGSTAEIWFSLPRYVNEYSLDGAGDYDLIEKGGRRIVHFKGDARSFPWRLHLLEDRIGPLVSIISLTPNPTEGAASVILKARADDTKTGGSDIAAVEFFIGNDPGIGQATMMEAVDGRFDSPVELVKMEKAILSLKAGGYPIYLRARDSSGNWGEIASSSFEVRWPPLSYVVHFDTAKVELKPEARAVLDKAAEAIKKYTNLSARIEGHTDPRRIQTKEFPSNYELSIGRANAVLEYLRSNYGIDIPIFIFGHADTKPVATNETSEGMARNRRTEILLFRED